MDFKGPIHHTVLQQMGILDAVKPASITNGDRLLVNAAGQKIDTVPGASADGEINIPPVDLARIPHGRTTQSSEHILSNSISMLTETGSGMEVTFARTAPTTFNFVIGAHGVHSNVRELVFVSESNYIRYLGHYYVLTSLDVGDADVIYNEPGRMASVGGSKA
ncbi:MAG: hypothetical protein ABI137_14675 [Antricoccus sp.]